MTPLAYQLSITDITAHLVAVRTAFYTTDQRQHPVIFAKLDPRQLYGA